MKALLIEWDRVMGDQTLFREDDNRYFRRAKIVNADSEIGYFYYNAVARNLDENSIRAYEEKYPFSQFLPISRIIKEQDISPKECREIYYMGDEYLGYNVFNDLNKLKTFLDLNQTASMNGHARASNDGPHACP